MFLMLCITSVVFASETNSFESANEALFENWRTTLHIPSITIGVPTDEELEESTKLLDEIYEQFIASTSEELSSTQREISVPFAMGMIEGIRSSTGDTKAANSCLKHLVDLDDAVEGWTASRLWRMRLHSYACLGMNDEARNCKKQILELKRADPEDQLVAVLHEIKKGEYEKWDHFLVSNNRTDLRWDFASGVASSNPEESLFAVFSLADDLTKHGANRITLDKRIRSLLLRIEPRIFATENHENKLVSSLASRLEIQSELSNKNYESARVRLTNCVDDGCVFSAQLLLTTSGIVPSPFETSTALDLVLQFPEETSYPLSYWQLFTGSHAAKTGNKSKAIQLFKKVSEESDYYADAKKMLRLLEGTAVEAIKQELEIAAKNGKKIDAVIEKIHAPEIAQQLLQQYIGLWHDEGVGKTPWLQEVISKLIVVAEDGSPAILAEVYRLLGEDEKAEKFFRLDIANNGESLQTTIGLADCQRDATSMRLAIHGIEPNRENHYWFWLANARLVHWFCE
ncbi:hypothetical protein H8D29_01030, partial [PVC group bacterium]|nr:hypothetical protein [PVC group bacterium]